MKNIKENNVFQEMMAPVLPLVKNMADNIPGDLEKYKLSILPFTLNILFWIICNIKTVSQLITHIKTFSLARELGLISVSKSMYSEAFARYNAELFRKLFYQLLESIHFVGIPELTTLGRIFLVDGSVFPAFISMTWAHYKKNCNAIKLHFAFELNKMVPAHFISTTGNYSERKFLLKIIKKGITYVCDRGYVGFELFKEICKQEAFFVIRGKLNMQYNISENLSIEIPEKFIQFLTETQDMKVVFTNDANNITYRIVTFSAMGELYVLITNRFDLTTYQIIMLYTYRWQVELIFRFFKRTLNGIHLMSQNENGVEVQFYLYMISYLLLLSFKQKYEILNDNHENPSTLNCSANLNDCKPIRQYVCGLVSLLGDGLQKYWKISLQN